MSIISYKCKITVRALTFLLISHQYKRYIGTYLKSSDAKASKCHLKFSFLMMIFIKLVYLSSVISLKWQ